MSVILAITGGKGGTGKSFVAVNLAVLLARRYRLVLADVDLEAPNDHILLGVDRLENEEPIKLFLPFIDPKRCTVCGVCAKVCDTGAILVPPKGFPVVFPRLCSGCKACYFACPSRAIMAGYHVLGYTYVTRVSKFGVEFTLVTGMLREGEEHTPPGVLATRRRAEDISADVLLVDTGAGTGNQISIALKGAGLVLAVTEPTELGLHDLEMILRITRGMKLKTWVIINRAGIGDDAKHVELAKMYGVERVFRIPYHRDAVESYVKGVPVVVYKPTSPVSKALIEIYEAVLEVIEGHAQA